jgi:cation diffusion facilitator family transporter
VVENRLRSSRAGKTVTIVGAALNTFLVLFKLFAGIFGQSQALIADAVHSISDLVTDLVVLLGLKFGRKGPDEEHPFGHGKIETLASATVGIALIVTALYLGVNAALNIYRHTEYHPKLLAVIGAGTSIVLKEALYWYTVRVGRRIKSQLVVANAWHHRSDALSSVAVLFGVAAARIRPTWHILDSYAALLVSFFVVKVSLDILKSILHEFTDTAPQGAILQKIRECTLGVEGVIDVHDVRVRTSGGLYQMETHIVVDGKLTIIEGHRIAKTVEGCLIKEIDDLERVIVHIDPNMEDAELK